VDPKHSQNYCPFVSHKMIDQEDFQEADSLEDFRAAEDSPEGEDIQEGEEYHQEDHQEEDGGLHRSLCPKPIKENW